MCNNVNIWIVNLFASVCVQYLYTMTSEYDLDNNKNYVAVLRIPS